MSLPALLLSVETNCDLAVNTLNWNNPNLTCADDVLKYHIYFSPLQGPIWSFSIPSALRLKPPTHILTTETSRVVMPS